MYDSIDAIKAANEAVGQTWFGKAEMRFFDGRVYDEVYGGRYFVTSEKGPDGVRKYSVRAADDDGYIETVGEFQGYATLDAARAAARKL